MLASSSNLRNPANDSKHAEANRILASVSLSLASCTIALSMSTVNGNFLLTGLASNLLSPSSVVLTIGESVGDKTPAVE